MLEFAKYHGTGNDFIMVEDLPGQLTIPPETVVALCDRRFGVGADGVIRVTKAEDADFSMEYHNADGTRDQMCGNGIRCLGRFVRDRGLTDKTELAVATRDGLKHLTLHLESGVVRSVTVDMGSPSFERSAIPMKGPPSETFLMQPVSAGGRSFTGTALYMGNPHLVLFLDEDPSEVAVQTIGPELETSETFPERTNVEFVKVAGDRLEARVWERGVGETVACGTGACAVVIAANEAGSVGRKAAVRFPGGVLEVERTADDRVLLTGPAERVFEGSVDEARLARRGTV
jgi:diaminopimelate epimerase